MTLQLLEYYEYRIHRFQAKNPLTDRDGAENP